MYQNLGKVIYMNSVLLINSSFGLAAMSITPELTS
jgi:hypothetical protein